jgi:hypothetical protein
MPGAGVDLRHRRREVVSHSSRREVQGVGDFLHAHRGTTEPQRVKFSVGEGAAFGVSRSHRHTSGFQLEGALRRGNPVFDTRDELNARLQVEKRTQGSPDEAFIVSDQKAVTFVES